MSENNEWLCMYLNVIRPVRVLLFSPHESCFFLLVLADAADLPRLVCSGEYTVGRISGSHGELSVLDPHKTKLCKLL